MDKGKLPIVREADWPIEDHMWLHTLRQDKNKNKPQKKKPRRRGGKT